MPFLGSLTPFYEEGDDEDPDVVLTPWDAAAEGFGAEVGDAQQMLMNWGHASSSNSGPLYLASPKGKFFVVTVSEARRVMSANLGYRVVDLEHIPPHSMGKVEDLSSEGEEAAFKTLIDEVGGIPEAPPAPEIRDEMEVGSSMGSASTPVGTSSVAVASPSRALSPTAWLSTEKGKQALRLAERVDVHPRVRSITAVSIGADLDVIKKRVARRVEDKKYTSKDLAAMQKDLARYLDLWMRFYSRKARSGVAGLRGRTKGAVGALRGKKGAELAAAEAKRLADQRRRADDLLRFMDIHETPADASMNGSAPSGDHTRMDISKNKSLLIIAEQRDEDTNLFEFGHAGTFYCGHFNFDDEDIAHAADLAHGFFQDLMGIPFGEIGVLEEDPVTGEHALVAKTTSGIKIAKVQDYVIDTRAENNIISGDSSLGHDIESDIVTEAGWMATVMSTKGLSLEGRLKGKTAKCGDVFLFSTMHIKSRKEGEPSIIVHLQSSGIPSHITKDKEESMQIPLVAIRGIQNGDYIDVSLKGAKRVMPCCAGGKKSFVQTELLL